MPQSSLMCVGLIAMSCRVCRRPMWHSTQSTRAWNATACDFDSSGCTAWHTFVQKLLLLLYSQPAMPAITAAAAMITPMTSVSAAPAIVRRPRLLFMRAPPRDPRADGCRGCFYLEHHTVDDQHDRD